MNREIKFKSIIKNDLGEFKSYIWEPFGDENNSNDILRDSERIIAFGLQFTGLKDKNGKEIYEGDILSFTRGVGNWSGKTLTTSHEVYYSDNISAFVLKAPGDYIKLRKLEGRYIYEITGNIYENQAINHK